MSDKPLRRLRELHHRLDTEIEAERGKLRPDLFRMAQLKKIKLGLKDQIHRLEAAAIRPVLA